ncbi:hypothetical protein BGZ65_011860 [Modicella reniformis]|uniref:Uncharacterized protein n=1 Tax=Modicella reniformis TaxID=1440133 RepID=A0A9P6MAE2_9FUNG|nr:hypothetical protein BGZ65_011860 [Modicella reniformis]
MSVYKWGDHHRENRETIRSWKQLLQGLDEQTVALTKTRSKSATPNNWNESMIRTDLTTLEDETTRLKRMRDCPQVLMFPPRPVLADLIPRDKQDDPFEKEPAAKPISAQAIKLLKYKRRRTNYHSTRLDDGTAARTNEDGPSFDSTLSISRLKTASRVNDGKEMMELESAIASLRSKLEMLQPEGMRPSDIAAAAATTTTSAKVSEQNSDNIAGLGKEESTDNNDVVLSQTTTSQRSILLWDEIRVVIGATGSSDVQLQSMANNVITMLGIDHLEDNVLHRLFINEIFVQIQDDGVGPTTEGSVQDEGVAAVELTKTPQLSYQFSVRLYSILLSKKALHLKSIPSRLFLDAVLNAGKAHGRAVVDSVLIPIIQDHINFSRLSSELIQKTLKEQTSTTLVYFLSCVFDPVVDQSSSNHNEQSIVNQLPIVFLSEVHIATVQTILGCNNVPCPLPIRLWGRFNAILDLLWDRVATLIASASIPSTPPGTLKESFETGNGSVWILKLYCPSSVWESLVKGNILKNQDPFRFSHPKLIQLVMTWTIRQGPMCPDVENLQRLREFCATKLDVKLGKGIISKLDMFIRKKNGQ